MMTDNTANRLSSTWNRRTRPTTF